MDLDFEKCILESKKMIMFNSSFKNEFKNYSACYFGTTEFISGYLDDIDYNKKNALTVIGSGDQIFNLIYKGILNIDAFDINILTYFNYYLKRAILLRLDFQEFKRLNKCYFYLFNKNNTEDFLNLLNHIKNELPDDVYEYYRILLDFHRKRLYYGYLNRLYREKSNYSKIKNSYANSEGNFLLTKKGLREASVNLMFENALEIPKLACNTYDVILLSNISDYIGVNNKIIINDFNNYLRMYQNILNSDGIIINYFFELAKKYVVKYSFIKKKDLNLDYLNELDLNNGYYLVRKKDELYGKN